MLERRRKRGNRKEGDMRNIVSIVEGRTRINHQIKIE